MPDEIILRHTAGGHDIDRIANAIPLIDRSCLMNFIFYRCVSAFVGLSGQLFTELIILDLQIWRITR